MMMSRYRFNPALDVLRLVRGIFCHRCRDPFIEAHPPSIRARKYLFQFVSIENETGNYSFDTGDYTPYVSPQPLLMKYLPEAYARDAFQHLMSAKSLRIKEVTALLGKYGIEATPTTDCWERIGKWMETHLEENREPAFLKLNPKEKNWVYFEAQLRPVWCSILLDLSLLLGEHALSKCNECSWQFWGDIDIKNPCGYGRSPWLLHEPLPKSRKWRHVPKRSLPFEKLLGGTSVALQNKLQGKNHSFSWGLLFDDMAVRADQAADEGSEDSQVTDLLEWLEEYKTTTDYLSTDDLQDTLDTFLQSYVEEKGSLPSASNLKLLEDAFTRLPDWV